MVLLTVGALLGESYIFRTKLVLSPNDHRVVEILDDSASGGNSTAKALDSQNSEWECTLGGHYAYPYCQMNLQLGADPVRGIDLRKYKKLRIWLDYKGPAKSVRLYLRDYDPRYSKPEDGSTTKFNQVELPVELLRNGVVDVPLSDFFVADWWIVNHSVAPGRRQPQFENVVIFEIQTGTADVGTTHHFKFNRMELTGQSIPKDRLYLAIVICWVIAVMLFLAYRITSLRGEVRLERARARELEEVNALLDHRGRELEEKTKHDQLTGAFNRHGVEEGLQAALGEWRRERKPTSLVLMDLDHFKQINDRHGHGFGDYVLAEVSRLVKGYLREKDLFARWGGEEFLLLCRGISTEEAQIVADKIRLLIARHDFDRGVRVTASFGVAALAGSDTLEQWFQAADRALYRAKDEGRNRVMLWQPAESVRLRVA